MNRSAMGPMAAGAVMISFSGVWVRLADVPPTVSAFYRVLFGSMFLLAAALAKGEFRGRKSFGILWTAACGIAFALDLLCYHHAVLKIGPGLGTILPNFEVFLLTAYGILFLGEKAGWRFLAALPIAVFGLFFIVGIDWNKLGRLFQVGVYFGFGAAFFYAVFILLLRGFQTGKAAGGSGIYTMLMVSLSTSVILGVWVAFSEDSFAIPTLKSAAALLTLGLFSQTVGWILITRSLPKIRASYAGLLLLMQPSLAFVWDVLLFQRPTSLLNWFGVLLTLTAIYLGLTAESE